MPISVRLDEETREILERTAKLLGCTRTDVLKESIKDFCNRQLQEKSKRPYDLIKDLVGEESSGRGDLSASTSRSTRNAFD